MIRGWWTYRCWRCDRRGPRTWDQCIHCGTARRGWLARRRVRPCRRCGESLYPRELNCVRCGRPRRSIVAAVVLVARGLLRRKPRTAPPAMVSATGWTPERVKAYRMQVERKAWLAAWTRAVNEILPDHLERMGLFAERHKWRARVEGDDFYYDHEPRLTVIHAAQGFDVPPEKSGQRWISRHLDFDQGTPIRVSAEIVQQAMEACVRELIALMHGRQRGTKAGENGAAACNS